MISTDFGKAKAPEPLPEENTENNVPEENTNQVTEDLPEENSVIEDGQNTENEEEEIL